MDSRAVKTALLTTNARRSNTMMGLKILKTQRCGVCRQNRRCQRAMGCIEPILVSRYLRESCINPGLVATESLTCCNQIAASSLGRSALAYRGYFSRTELIDS